MISDHSPAPRAEAAIIRLLEAYTPRPLLTPSEVRTLRLVLEGTIGGLHVRLDALAKASARLSKRLQLLEGRKRTSGSRVRA